MEFITKPDFQEAGQKFWQAYDLINIVAPPETNNKKDLKKKDDRKCRYCGNSIPATTFKKDAHLIPELLGNKTLFCDYECDVCNALFGKYEDHFAKLVEVERPLHKVRGKEKFPGFTSPNRDSKIRVKEFQEKQSIQISRSETGNDPMSFDIEKGIWKLKLARNSFVPNKVYKFLIKLAISIIPEYEVLHNYKYGIDYILGKLNGSLSGCRLIGYYLPLSVKFIPHIYLFRKRDPKTKTHTHVIAFYFLNYIFALPVPLNETDFWFYNEEVTAINYPPLFINGYPINNINITPFYEDFTSEEKQKLEDQEVFFEINKEDWENRSGFDTINEQIIDGSNFDPNSIVKIIIMDRDDDSIKLPIKKSDID
ncbi:MAG: HNH endonuclease [Dyadobacter sp.]